MLNNLDQLQDVGVKGFTMWKDEVKGLDLKHALKVVEIQARWGDIILPFTAVSFLIKTLIKHSLSESIRNS